MKFFILLGLIFSVQALKFQQAWSRTHSAEVSEILQHVNTQCLMTVNTENRTVSLLTPQGTYTIKDGVMQDEHGVVVQEPMQEAFLCESQSGVTSKSSHAMFWVASGAAYLQGTSHRFDHNVNVWDAFVNKHCWAKANNMKYFLWIGSPVDTLSKNLKEKDALSCAESKLSNHYLKPVGMLALLEKNPSVEWVISMDISDSYFPVQRLHENHFDKFLNVDGAGADVVAGSLMGGTTQKFLNSAVMGMKNTPWTKTLLAEWFKNRCSPQDQLSLWHSLFKLFKKDKPEFTWDPEKMSTYVKASHYGFSRISQLVRAEEMEEYQEWYKTGHLRSIIHLPHVTYLPNTGDKDFVGFRANTDRTVEPFICHNKASSVQSCNVKNSMCSPKEPKQCTCE